VNTSGSHVAVVGGGFAGLAAAVRLARAGARVTLLERRPFLGGRAYSFTDPVTGDVIDNGPHALMGAYTAALDFLGEIGAASKLAFQPRLHVTLADPALGLGAVVAPRVPGPFQAPAALLRYRLLSPGDRLRLLVGAVRLAARPVASLREHTVAAALAMAGQSAAACARFWHPLAIATLNEAPEVAAAAPFAAVLRKAFFAGARAARFAVPRVPLSELYTADAQRALERAGGTVVTGAAVATLALDPGGRLCVTSSRFARSPASRRHRSSACTCGSTAPSGGARRSSVSSGAGRSGSSTAGRPPAVATGSRA